MSFFKLYYVHFDTLFAHTSHSLATKILQKCTKNALFSIFYDSNETQL
jgi:hypothetical protein